LCAHPSAARGGSILATSKRTARIAAENLILSSLDATEYDVLWPHLEVCSLQWHMELHEPGEPIEFGYFPSSGVVSLMVAVSDGRTVEVGIVGREGFIGALLAGGLKKSPHRSLVQVPGEGHRIRAKALQSLLPSTPNLRVLLTRYALVQGMQLAQTAACNRLHNLEQRLARWLLMTHDRANSQTLAMTHERLASLLGTDRPSVSEAASALQKYGIISYQRGVVRILSRRNLREAACECYGVIQSYYSQLGLH